MLRRFIIDPQYRLAGWWIGTRPYGHLQLVLKINVWSGIESDRSTLFDLSYIALAVIPVPSPGPQSWGEPRVVQLARLRRPAVFSLLTFYRAGKWVLQSLNAAAPAFSLFFPRIVPLCAVLSCRAPAGSPAACLLCIVPSSLDSIFASSRHFTYGSLFMAFFSITDLH